MIADVSHSKFQVATANNVRRYNKVFNQPPVAITTGVPERNGFRKSLENVLFNRTTESSCSRLFPSILTTNPTDSSPAFFMRQGSIILLSFRMSTQSTLRPYQLRFYRTLNRMNG